MRVIEHKKFDYKSAYYAEELRKLYKLQDEYLLLVKNDIRNISGLIRFMEDKENEIKSIDERQHEIYKENQRRKRKVVTTEYMALALENRVDLHGVLDGKLGADVFGVVRRNFEKAGYSVAFDDISDEAIAIKKYISEQKCINSAEMIVEKLQEYGSYEKIPLVVKAEVFGFEIDDSSGNLKLYMQVVKALGVRMSQEEMFEDYQKVYEETVKRQGEDEMQNDKMRERGRAR